MPYVDAVITPIATPGTMDSMLPKNLLRSGIQEGHYFRDAIRLRRSRVAENLSGVNWPVGKEISMNQVDKSLHDHHQVMSCGSTSCRAG